MKFQLFERGEYLRYNAKISWSSMFPVLGTIAFGWYSLLLSWANRASGQNFSCLQWPACYRSYDTIDLFRVCRFASSRENVAPRVWFRQRAAYLREVAARGEFHGSRLMVWPGSHLTGSQSKMLGGYSAC